MWISEARTMDSVWGKRSETPGTRRVNSTTLSSLSFANDTSWKTAPIFTGERGPRPPGKPVARSGVWKMGRESLEAPPPLPLPGENAEE